LERVGDFTAISISAWPTIQALVGSASAALKPLATDLHPIGNKAVAVYKTTPQGYLKINLYFPPEWRNTDRRPAIVFFFGGSCATGGPAQFATTAEYFAMRGLLAAPRSIALRASTTPLRGRAPKMAKAPSAGYA
jgi:hypothetical protein